MPLIMDDEQQYMEDLFGDSDAVQIPIAAPPVKGLAQRLDELHETGCCQKLAWSKNGCVASITKDGRGVVLKQFHRDPQNGNWVLGDDFLMDLSPVHEEFPFIHLSWSDLGTELAVVDTAGRMYMYTSSFSTGRMSPARHSLADQEDERGCLVGMYWLPIIPHQSKCLIVWSATRNDSKWGYNITSHTFNDPHNPVENKSAVVGFSKGGALRLLYQQPDGHWAETSTEIENVSVSKGPFSHAAFASDNNKSLLMVAYDVSGHLYVYRVHIAWGAIPPHKPGQPIRHMDPPSIELVYLCGTDCSSILDSPTDESGMSTDSLDGLSSSLQLTHLNFVPAAPEQGQALTSPTIMAIFSRAAVPHMSLPHEQHQQSLQSVVVRWEVKSAHQNRLHLSFDQLKVKKKSVNSVEARENFQLTRDADVLISSPVITISPALYNTMFSFYLSDGTVEFRHRATLSLITPDFSNEQVSSLPQAGFAFPRSEPSLYIAMSANCCVAAHLRHDGSIQTKTMEYTHGPWNILEEDPAKISAAIAALAVQHSNSCFQYINSDDILALIPPNLSKAWKHTFYSQVYQTLNVNLDYTPTEGIHDRIGRTLLVRCLSAQNVLGHSADGQRDLASNLAWVIMNIRQACINMSVVMRFNNGSDKPLKKETASTVEGLCKWMFDFIAYMLDELMVLAYHLRDKEISKAVLQDYIEEKRSPALLVLLSSYPRGMLKAWFQPLQWISKSAAVILNNPNAPPDHRRQYMMLHSLFVESSENLKAFDNLLQETNGYVRKAYANAGLNDAERGRMERDLVTQCDLPEVFVPLAKHLLTEKWFGQQGVLESINAGKIMFKDLSWLGLTDDRRSRDFAKRHKVDTMSKSLLSSACIKERRFKRCTRCWALTEDLLPSMGSMYWAIFVSKKCMCDNPWMLPLHDRPEKHLVKGSTGGV